jgi:hypothetical protein
LPQYDAIIFGTPTRFGNMCAQMRNFLDQTGRLWMSGALIGKVCSVFASTGTQHGGQETTITSFHSTLLHHSMIIVGLRELAWGCEHFGPPILTDDLVTEPLRFAGFHIHLPTGPGLGVTLGPDKLHRYARQ